jgi:hypothetical protein
MDCAYRFALVQRLVSDSAFTGVMSRTDCISMEVIRRGARSEMLTNDEHFNKEGFTYLPNPAEPEPNRVAARLCFGVGRDTLEDGDEPLR